jgi:multiple sugar transport system permease protein
MTVRREGIDRSIVPGVVRPAEAAGPGRFGGWTSGRVAFLVLLFLATVAFLTPFVWLVSQSLKTQGEVFNAEWIPSPLMLQNYLTVFQLAPTAVWTFNSALVAVLGVVTVVFTSAFVAFGFAYFRFPGRDLIFGIVLATMLLPGVVTMIPSYLIWNTLGWTNTHVPLWAGGLFGSAFYIFMLRQFFLGLPRDLFEAARVDGASYLQMWRRVALPLVKPALLVVAVFEFKAKWTDIMGPLIYLHDRELYTLPLGLYSLVQEFGQGGIQRYELIMAGSVLVTIPMIVLFLVFQRHFVQGIATTGSKG